MQVACSAVSLAGAAPKRIRLLSCNLGAQERTSILFVNASTRVVRAVWINYEGNGERRIWVVQRGDSWAGRRLLTRPCLLAEVPYMCLLPGEHKRYLTFVAHLWVMRVSSRGAQLRVPWQHGVKQAARVAA